MEASSEIEHFEHRDDFGSKIGMWLFLFTEVLLFGGLFLVYAVYRYWNPEAFEKASMDLNVLLGTFNTFVLITSSWTVAMSITAIQKNEVKKAINLLLFTVACAIIFMVVKYFEWGHKIHMDLYPGSEAFKSLEPAEGLYFVLYYFMTGLHALHVVVGSIFILFVISYIKKGSIAQDNFQILENCGLYWHLVDLIWIFLFPLMYLIH